MAAHSPARLDLGSRAARLPYGRSTRLLTTRFSSDIIETVTSPGLVVRYDNPFVPDHLIVAAEGELEPLNSFQGTTDPCSS